MEVPFRRIGEVEFEVPRDFRPDMRVPVRVLADEQLLAQVTHDRSLEQLINVATLPGITRHAIGMPDMHQGYGFPVGGVAGTVLPDGVISPGGIGFDINCGVRLLASALDARALGPLEPLVHELSRAIPVGYGRHGRIVLDRCELDRVLAGGCTYLVRERGLGLAADLDFTESRGTLADADPG
ncbi:MAG: RtcB family protein, partial [Myxococcales bacterium]